MDKPIIAAHAPMLIEVEKDKGLWWCACGLSKKQPFCDGSHKGTTTIMPVYFVPDKDGVASLCMCKHTSTPPYCDQTHCTLEK